MFRPLILFCLAYFSSPADAAVARSTAAAEDFYNAHFQTTIIDQGHFKFHSPYQGQNSQRATTESDASVTSTMFLGLRPWKGTELYINPELSGGQGMSGALGIAGFPNGETYRIGNPRPVIKTSRLYVQQVFGFGGATEKVEDGPNQIAGAVDAERLTVWAGKFGIMDWFDNNAYSHDPRTQFMNWALANSPAWDYPADTYGYTWGLAAEYHAPAWAIRGAAVTEPRLANQVDMDRNLRRSHGFALEGEHQSPWPDHKGTFRFLLYCNEARMGNYKQALSQALQAGNAPDVTLSRAYGHTKFGFTSSDDLALTDHLGAFTRLSWDDGRNETWAYDEVDASWSLGLDWLAARWGRPNDHFAVAQIMNMLSDPHRLYLTNGGMGFMLGDGSMHYRPEYITEIYYRLQWKEWLQISPDGQFIFNPGYNRDRGPIAVWGVRVHAQF